MPPASNHELKTVVIPSIAWCCNLYWGFLGLYVDLGVTAPQTLLIVPRKTFWQYANHLWACIVILGFLDHGACIGGNREASVGANNTNSPRWHILLLTFQRQYQLILPRHSVALLVAFPSKYLFNVGVSLQRGRVVIYVGGLSLSVQWPAANLCHTEVSAQLGWNLYRGDTKKAPQVPGTRFR